MKFIFLLTLFLFNFAYAYVAPNEITTDKIANSAVTTAKIANGNVTYDKLQTPNQTAAASLSGTATFPSQASYAVVTNQTITLTTHGRPVLLWNCSNVPSPGFSGVWGSSATGATGGMWIAWTSDATGSKAYESENKYVMTATGTTAWSFPVNIIPVISSSKVGLTTFTLETKTETNTTANFQNIRICALEM